LSAYSLLGQIYASQRKIPEAIREFDELSKRQPNHVGAHTVVGMLLQISDRRREAKERYQKALSIDPNAAVPANNLAWLQMEDGDNLDVALQHAQTALAGLPESPEVNDTLGYIYLKKGLHTQAINALKVSVERDPKNPMYLYRLGTAYAAAGDTALARQSFDQALKLDPNFPEADAAKAALASMR
jgi:tetratricopeptide (TPR) repeat protein